VTGVTEYERIEAFVQLVTYRETTKLANKPTRPGNTQAKQADPSQAKLELIVLHVHTTGTAQSLSSY